MKEIFVAAVPKMTTTTPLPTTTSAPFLNSTQMPDESIMYFFFRYPAKITMRKSRRPMLPYQDNTSSFKLKSIEINRSMEPSCQLIVFYVRGEEVVSDETDFNVEFGNKVGFFVYLCVFSNSLCVNVCFGLMQLHPKGVILISFKI